MRWQSYVLVFSSPRTEFALDITKAMPRVASPTLSRSSLQNQTASIANDHSGYSSVGRAFACRISSYQMVPGSIPDGRTFALQLNSVFFSPCMSCLASPYIPWRPHTYPGVPIHTQLLVSYTDTSARTYASSSGRTLFQEDAE